MNTASNTTPAWDFEFRSDLVVTGRDPEDGEEIYGHCWYVVATHERGTRYAHDHAVTVPCRDDVPAAITSLRDRAASANISPVGRDHWHPIEPVYGSRAYVCAEPELVAMEKRDALDWEANNPGCSFR